MRTMDNYLSFGSIPPWCSKNKVVDDVYAYANACAYSSAFLLDIRTAQAQEIRTNNFCSAYACVAGVRITVILVPVLMS